MIWIGDDYPAIAATITGFLTETPTDRENDDGRG
jgi:hypothetical protein